MALRSEIQESQYEAMKQGDADRLSVLRLLVSAIKNEEKESKKELSDEEVQAIVQRQAKQLKDAIKDFESGGRSDLVEKTQKEIDIMSEYLPEQMSEDELTKVVEKTIADLSAGAQDIGRVMGAVMKEVKGKADGNMVRGIVTKKLT